MSQEIMNGLLKGAALVTSLAFGLEAGTRVDEWVRWKTPIFSNVQSVAELIRVDSTGGRGIPGAHFRQFAINSLGFRGPEPIGGLPRVLVVGASETFGLYETAGQEFPRQLQDSLAARGCRVDVLNAGLPGFSLPTITATYLHRLRGLHASLVVLYPTPVQYLDTELPVWKPPAVPRGGPEGSVRLRVVRRLRDHLKVVLPRFVQTYLRSREISSSRATMSPGYRFDSIPSDRLAAFGKDLRSLIDSMRTSGGRVIVATHSNSFPPGKPVDTARLIAWTKFYPRASTSVLPAFERAANEQILAEAQSAGATGVDLALAMSKVDPERNFADFSHFTEHGSSVVAHVSATEIMERVGCPATR